MFEALQNQRNTKIQKDQEIAKKLIERFTKRKNNAMIKHKELQKHLKQISKKRNGKTNTTINS